MGGATGAIVSGRPVICGGQSRGFGTYRSECYHHSKTTNTWTFLTPMTTKRSFTASVPLNGKLWVMGGYAPNNNILSSTEFLPLDGGPSQPGPELPSPRNGHCAVTLSSGQVMLLGGAYPENKSVIRFDLDTQTFNTSLPSMRFDRYAFGCTVFNSAMHDNREVVLAVGGDGESSAEVLDHTQPNAQWAASNYSFLLLYNSILKKSQMPCPFKGPIIFRHSNTFELVHTQHFHLRI